jgi:hypothetical protein
MKMSSSVSKTSLFIAALFKWDYLHLKKYLLLGRRNTHMPPRTLNAVGTKKDNEEGVRISGIRLNASVVF